MEMTSEELYLYGPEFSPYVKGIRMYAEELGIELDSGREPGGELVGYKSEQHLALNPLGKFPVLIHGEFVLYESASICRYLDELAGKGSPLSALDGKSRALVDQWTSVVCTYCNSELMHGLLLEMAFPKGEDGKPRLDVMRENIPAARAFLNIIERQLDTNVWLTGEVYSMADSMLAPFIHYGCMLPDLDGLGQLIPADSRIATYLTAHKARPSSHLLA